MDMWPEGGEETETEEKEEEGSEEEKEPKLGGSRMRWRHERRRRRWLRLSPSKGTLEQGAAPASVAFGRGKLRLVGDARDGGNVRRHVGLYFSFQLVSLHACTTCATRELASLSIFWQLCSFPTH